MNTGEGGQRGEPEPITRAEYIGHESRLIQLETRMPDKLVSRLSTLETWNNVYRWAFGVTMGMAVAVVGMIVRVLTLPA